MASINNLAATGDIFIKVGQKITGHTISHAELNSASTNQVVAKGDVFERSFSTLQHLKNHAIVFQGTGKDKGKIKLITNVVSSGGTTVDVKPDFSVEADTPFDIHEVDFLADENGIIVSGSITGIQPGESSQDLATRAYVDDVVVGGRFSVWNYMRIFEPSDAIADNGEYVFTDDAGNGIIVDMRNAMVTRNGSILEPITDYEFVEESAGITKIVMKNPTGSQDHNVVVRATLGVSENLNAGIEYVETISNDSTSEIVLPFIIYDKAATLVTVDGVVQSSENYEIARTPVEDGYELKVIRFKDGETLTPNSVFRAVNLKGAAFLGNVNVSVVINDDTPTNDGGDPPQPTTVGASNFYKVTREQLISRNGLNLYANTTSPVDIHLPLMGYGHSTDDSIRIKVKRNKGAARVRILADAGNHFNYEGLDMSSGSISTAQGGYVENSEESPDYVTKLDFEWESAYNTWVINNGIGTWNVSRDS